MADFLFISYCPETSDTEFVPSPVPAGALQATAAVLYVAQAAFLDVFHVLRVDFTEALKVAQAVLTAALTADPVERAYADCNAVALAV